MHSPFTQLWPVAQHAWLQQTFDARWLFWVQPVQLPLRQVESPQQSQLPVQLPPGSRQQRWPASTVPHWAYASQTVAPPVWQQLLCPLPVQVASRLVQQVPLASTQVWLVPHPDPHTPPQPSEPHTRLEQEGVQQVPAAALVHRLPAAQQMEPHSVAPAPVLQV